MEKYPLPKWLVSICEPAEFKKWLNGKAQAHVKRDRRRGMTVNRELYKGEIYRAVLESEGLDQYTGKSLRWKLINKYNNNDSTRGRKEYKREFRDLPTIDHVYDSSKKPEFKICSWRVNDCKSDLTIKEFIELCNDILTYHKQQSV